MLADSALKSDAELNTRNRIQRFLAKIRKSELGAALTGYELTAGATWNPAEPGITQAESKRRMANIINYLEKETNNLGGFYNVDTPYSQNPVYTPPPDAADEYPRQNINGVTYTQLPDGSWVTGEQ